MEFVKDYRRKLSHADYKEIKSSLEVGDLTELLEAWRFFRPMERLLLFKLMEPRRALDFYSQLEFNERYFLLCAYEPNSIAPVLEKLSPQNRALFKPLPAVYYDRMLKMIVSDQIEIQLSATNN